MKKKKIQIVLAIAVVATLSGSIMGQVAFAAENEISNSAKQENQREESNANNNEQKNNDNNGDIKENDNKEDIKENESKVIPINAWDDNKVLMNEVCKRTNIEDISKVTYDDIKKIDELNLTCCLYKIPEILKEFTGLTRVDLSGSPEAEVALNYLSNVKGIKELNLNGTDAINLDKVAENFKELIRIDIDDNKYGKLPDAIYKMENLQMIYANRCEISTISPEISKLMKLETLDLSNNSISDLPDEIEQLQSLKTVELSGNKFDEIPLVLFKIQKMSTLSMTDNKLISIPKEIINMKGNDNPFMLLVGSNQIASLPETNGQKIQHVYNFLPSDEETKGLEIQLSLMQNTNIQLKENEKLTQERLRDLVWVYSDNDNNIKLDDKHKLELVIDGKVVSGDDVAKLAKGRYKAEIKLVGADIDNKNANGGAINLEIGDGLESNEADSNESSKGDTTEPSDTNTSTDNITNGLLGNLPKTGGVAAATIALLGGGSLAAGLTMFKRRRK